MKYLLTVILLWLAVPGFAQADLDPGWKFISPDDLNQWMQGARTDFLLINTLSPIEFRQCSIINSISIPLEWIDQPDKLPADKNKFLVFYCCSQRCAISRRAADIAVKKGYLNVFVLEAGLPAWKEKSFPTVSQERVEPLNVLSLKPKALLKFLKEREDWLILDIRSQEQYAKEHLRNSINISFTDLDAHYHDLPLNKKIIVVDEVGHRSFLACRFLKMKGIQDVQRLFGGMEEWTETVGNEFVETEPGTAGK